MNHMLKSISIAAATLALCVVGGTMLPIPGQQVAAQSAGLFVNAVDLDIVPAEREKFLAAIRHPQSGKRPEPLLPL
jgi:hypothetical protein